MESRQGQFPATFPDTFKNFFSMLNEEEDHVELFSNLLEDKVKNPVTYKPAFQVLLWPYHFRSLNYLDYSSIK